MNFEQLANLITITCYFLIGSISLFTLIGLYIVFWDSLIDAIERFFDWIAKPAKKQQEQDTLKQQEQDTFKNWVYGKFAEQLTANNKIQATFTGHRSLMAEEMRCNDELKKRINILEETVKAQKEVLGQLEIKQRELIDRLPAPNRKTSKRKK